MEEQNYSVSQMKSAEEIAVMSFCSNGFKEELDKLFAIDRKINENNPKSLTLSDEKTLQKLKWDKVELKKILNSEISCYRANRAKWVSENYEGTSEKAAPFLIDFILDKNTEEILPEEPCFEFINEIITEVYDSDQIYV